MIPAQPTLSPRSAEPGRVSMAQREIAQAQEDYRRLRGAYLELAKSQHNEVALAMVGADMDRAHAALHALPGLRQLPFADEPGELLRRPARRMESA